ncbi:hypothetical protein ACHQM5_020459 [Ranunculus cassubicifolius]
MFDDPLLHVDAHLHIRRASNVTDACFPTHHIHTRGLWFADSPFDYPLDLLLFQISLVSVVSCLVVSILKPLGNPAIVSQIISGILLGRSSFGHHLKFLAIVFPMRGKVTFEVLSLVGFIYVQFLIGVRTDLTVIFSSGKRVISIGALGYIFPVVVGGFASLLLRNYMPVDPNIARVLRLIVGTQSMSSFPVISCFLTDLKILNSELGRIASSSAIVSDLCSFITICFVRLTIMARTEYGFEKILGAVGSSLVLLSIILFLVRPFSLWVIRRTPQGKPVKEVYIFCFIVAVLVCTFSSLVMGLGYILAPFILGLVIPDGPPLGSALEERITSFVSVLLMPIFFTLIGLKTDFFSLDETAWVIHLVIFICFLAKTIGIMLPNIYCRMPWRDACLLGLIMNSKGIVELALYNTWLEDKILSRKVFTLLIISLLLITVTVSRLVRTFYNPARRYMPHKRRTIQHAKNTPELGILTCVHSQDNVPALIQLLDISNPKKEQPLHVCALHLIELVGRASSLLIAHKHNGKQTSKPQRSEPVIKAFRYYQESRPGLVWVDVFTSISPSATMHDDVCSLALDKRSVLIILPFHKQWVAEGASVEASTAICNLNCNVLENAPCSVGILISHRYLTSSQTLLPRKQIYRIAVVFLGGADDREALSYARRMAEHPTVRFTMIRISLEEDIHMDQRMKMLDNEILEGFKNETLLGNDRVSLKEEFVLDGTGVMSVLRSIENGYDLVMVGRRHAESPLTLGLKEWTEHPELGIIGDILAAPDFKGVPSILVVQQQARVRGMQNP